MKRTRTRKRGLMVSDEAIEDFLVLSTAQRLKWLDEMRNFLSKTLPQDTKRIQDEMRRGSSLR